MANLILKFGNRSIGTTTNGGSVVTYRNSISQHGITWTFDKSYPTGQFVSGDWWVAPKTTGGTVNIVSVNPPSQYMTNILNLCNFASPPVILGRTNAHVNCSFKNPVVGATQGFDSRADGWTPALCVGYNPTTQNLSTISLRSGDRLLSSIGIVNDSDARITDVTGRFRYVQRTKVKSISVLTCVAVIPPADAFRPPVVGSSSSSYYLSSNINWGLLPSVAAVSTTNMVHTASSTNRWAQYASFFARPQMLHLINDYGESIKAGENGSGYYRYEYLDMSDAALLCVMNAGANEADRRRLVINLIQYAIDLRAAGQTVNLIDRCWQRFPTILASVLLGTDLTAPKHIESVKTDSCYHATGWSNAYRNGVPASTVFWGDGGRTWQDDDPWAFVDVEGYSMSPWCQDLNAPGTYGTANGWKMEGYSRWNVFLVGIGLATRLLPGGMALWDDSAFFDYVDRWMNEDEQWLTNLNTLYGTIPCSPLGVETNAFGPKEMTGAPYANYFVRLMWNAYR